MTFKRFFGACALSSLLATIVRLLLVLAFGGDTASGLLFSGALGGAALYAVLWDDAVCPRWLRNGGNHAP